MTTPPPISCLHWNSDGELALEDYLDLPMGLIDINAGIGQTDPFGELSTCKKIPRANIRQNLNKMMETSCTDRQIVQEINQNRVPKIRVNIRARS